MKFLITNDDGIDAPGIAALAVAASEFGEVVIAAPIDHLSGCSHTTTTGEGIRIDDRGENRFAVHGTPADCARLGIWTLARDFDWILSGVNSGGNLGADAYYSGTIAAVREACLHGRQGIAFSMFRRQAKPHNWDNARRWTVEVLRELLATPLTLRTFWNVNLPCLDAGTPEPKRVRCVLDPNPLTLAFVPEGDERERTLRSAGDYFTRPRIPGGDVAVCFGGDISMSVLSLYS